MTEKLLWTRGRLTSEVDFADLQDVIAALQPSIALGNAAGYERLDHDASAPSAHQDESESAEARAVVDQINHLDLRPLTAQNHFFVSLLQFSTATCPSKFIVHPTSTASLNIFALLLSTGAARLQLLHLLA
jgi:hypothetical protein